MARAPHENPEVLDLMAAPLRDQVPTLTRWGMPETGLLILMSPCLGRCFFCAHPEVTHMPAHMITPSKRVRDWFDGARHLPTDLLCIGGTEPTTHADFDHALALAADAGFQRVQLMTSGVRLAEASQAQRWWDAGVREVCVPLYAHTADAHDAVVRVPGQFDVVVAGLDAAAALGMSIRVHTLSLQRTAHVLAPLAHWVRDRWGTTLTITPLREKAELFRYKDASLSYGDLRSALGDAPVRTFGFPSCALTDLPRGAPEIIALYFRGQATTYAPGPCDGCALRTDCLGVVPAHVRDHGVDELTPQH